MPAGKLAQFSDQKYLNLESFRRDGQGIQTPVWFAERGGVFYAYTLADSFKVKRIRNNPRVRIAPCDFRGKVTGEWIEASAKILDQSEDRRVQELLDRKYGLIKRIANFINRFRDRNYAYLAIEAE
ncbi:MAG: PPOX class F420-dependent oxidoreductase [Acidobacteriota bacterium]|nr:MAG: PPOX class F420-dependent oxidoreductase [Acidobacteriota bacterium]